MNFPLILCRRRTLVIAGRGFFDRIGKISELESTLDINVAHDGAAWLNWIIDLDGKYYALTSEGLLRTTLLQMLAFQRRVERFHLHAPRIIQAAELGRLIEGLADESGGLTNVTDLKALVGAMAPTTNITRELLRGYFGE